MKTETNIVIMRILISEDDQYNGESLYKYLISFFRRERIAGATAYRGIMGYGASRMVHTASILDMDEDLPVVVEVIDTQENLDRVIPQLEEIIETGTLLLEPAKIIRFRANK